MTEFDRKNHWEKIYTTKSLEQVSWYEAKPTISLDFIKDFKIAKNAKIIDVGGGESLLVDNLLSEGFEDITVLDISEVALEKAKKRLGEKAKLVKWIVADAAKFTPNEKYDFWHDRAAFHFLTNETEVNHYLETVRKSITETGVLLIGTFSENGPLKCSGIEIKQYSENSMSELLNRFFLKIKCVTIDHITPFETIQNFIFCSFKKLQMS